MTSWIEHRVAAPERLPLARQQQLIRLAQAGDMAAKTVLMDRYEPLIYPICRRFHPPGYEPDDVLQEARLALFTAILAQDPSWPAPFLFFARKVVETRMLELVEAARRKKRMLLIEAAPLNDDSDLELWEGWLIDPAAPDPDWLLDREMLRATLLRVMPPLTPDERRALWSIAAGRAPAEMSRLWGRTREAWQGAWLRARLKCRRAAHELDWGGD